MPEHRISEQQSSSNPYDDHLNEFGHLDTDPLEQSDWLDWDSWAGTDCPVCGVPWGTGGCHRCLLISAEIFELEDHLDEL